MAFGYVTPSTIEKNERGNMILAMYGSKWSIVGIVGYESIDHIDTWWNDKTPCHFFVQLFEINETSWYRYRPENKNIGTHFLFAILFSSQSAAMRPLVYTSLVDCM